ncbi:MAG: hypothetical protein AB1476_06040 [Candidatus Hadarchaeota archaeon]
MKVAIQGLGEVPTTVMVVFEEEKPDISYVICSEYQLKHVAKMYGYTKTNEEIIQEAAAKAGVKLEFCVKDVFDPAVVGECLGEILNKLNPKEDEVIVNYTGGSAVVRLLLGTLGVVLSMVMKARVIYAIKYPHGVDVSADHTDALRDIFQRLKIIT